MQLFWDRYNWRVSSSISGIQAAKRSPSARVKSILSRMNFRNGAAM
ncbi:MAG: hypothetical protein ACI9DF_005155, partial [Verrucomicrobiales bacterium]